MRPQIYAVKPFRKTNYYLQAKMKMKLPDLKLMKYWEKHIDLVVFTNNIKICTILNWYEMQVLLSSQNNNTFYLF